MSVSTCPRCGAPLTSSSRVGLVRCEQCDFIPGVTALEEVAPQVPNEKTLSPILPPQRDLMFTGALTPRARSLYYSGVSSLDRGELTQAIDYFEDALAIQPDFVDAHLAIARASDDPKRQREHLSAVIAYAPGNAEALRLWMLVNGDLTPEEAARAAGDQMPTVHRAEQPVKTRTQALLCSVCGGHMTVDEETGQAVCRFCGHEIEPEARREIGARALGMALISRKAQPERWIISERLLHCNRCGAERTIPATTLSTACPFCGSTHVIQQDAAGSFIRPDGVIPFRLTERDAVEAIKRALNAPLEKLAGLFDDNRVKSGVVEGTFVPFWVFDVTVDIRRVVTSELQQGFGTALALPVSTREERFTDAIFHLAIPGLKPLPKKMSRQIADYAFGAVVSYDPQLLARYPAALYDVDFDAASLSARGEASQTMREKHRSVSYDDDKAVSVSTSVQSMTFSLLLLPVYSVTLKERDGDVRPALVNGQTGTVALGKTLKAKRR
ncbi:MAG: hypothetical protein IT320_12685 [Anaerolineae bacterium]|nr:hypothetical protein [Anaerolineae bacterium]